MDAFHAAALAADGRDSGAGGDSYGGSSCAAFVLDPDGHNIEAAFHGAVNRRLPDGGGQHDPKPAPAPVPLVRRRLLD